MKSQVFPIALVVMPLLLAVLLPGIAGADCPCAHRPDLGAAVDALVKDVIAKTPELAHVDPSRILFIAADARHASRATTRPVKFPDGTTATADGRWERPKTTWRGKGILYIVELRPRFFRTSSVEARIRTIFHELLHMSPAFDGTIPDENSHKRKGISFDAMLPGMIARYLAAADAAVVRPLAREGEVEMRQWLERPPNKLPAAKKDARRAYGDADVFTGPVELVTKRSVLKHLLEGQAKGPIKGATGDFGSGEIDD